MTDVVFITEWRPRSGYRYVGLLATEWTDDIANFAGRTWTRLVQNHGEWHKDIYTYLYPALGEVRLYMIIMIYCYRYYITPTYLLR